MSKKLGLTYRDQELVDILKTAGFQKNVARSLVYMLKVREASSRGIELATGLRQPEVSIAMQKLKSRGWVTASEIKGKGKGRPTHSYSLAMKPARIIRKIEESELQRIREIKDNLQTLKKLAR